MPTNYASLLRTATLDRLGIFLLTNKVNRNLLHECVDMLFAYKQVVEVSLLLLAYKKASNLPLNLNPSVSVFLIEILIALFSCAQSDGHNRFPLYSSFSERERESFILRQHGPGVSIWREPQIWHVAPSTGRLSCGLGLSIYCTPDNVHGLIFARRVCINKKSLAGLTHNPYS